MSPENFIYWLQGYFEISGNKKLNESQVQVIKDHLKLVFDKQTPNRETSTTIKFCNPSPFISPAGPFIDLSKGPVCTASGSANVGLTLNDGVAPLTFDQVVSPLTTDGGVSPLTFEGKNHTLSSKGIASEKI
jgi:hypothetical protein